MVKSSYPQAPETFGPSEKDFRAGYFLQPSSPLGKTPANLWFKVLPRDGECGFVKPTGAGEGIRTLDPDLGKVVLYH